jgi:hypothetical protein
MTKTARAYIFPAAVFPLAQAAIFPAFDALCPPLDCLM